VSATPSIAEKFIKARYAASTNPPENDSRKRGTTPSYRATSGLSARSTTSSLDPKKDPGTSVINISAGKKSDFHSARDKQKDLPSIGGTSNNPNASTSNNNADAEDVALAEELDFVTVDSVGSTSSRDKVSRPFAIKHRRSMEPIPASARTSMVSSRSYREPAPAPSFVPTLPLTSLYVVSGLPKSPHTWTLADPDSVLGLHHSEGAVSRWWRPEVLGSTVSPGAGGGKKKKKGKGDSETMKGAGALSKQEVGKMLSKALKV
jgi:hypothetical protein